MQFVKAPFVFKCSSLKHHLFSKNIIQSFLCDCEDSKHFLLDCPLYINLRQEIIGVISNLCIPTLNVLLCGNQTLSFDVNKQIFLAIKITSLGPKDVKNYQNARPLTHPHSLLEELDIINI